jgi:hypothetical protein
MTVWTWDVLGDPVRADQARGHTQEAIRRANQKPDGVLITDELALTSEDLEILGNCDVVKELLDSTCVM